MVGRVIVCGSRTWTNGELIYEEINQPWLDPDNTIIVHGDALGADRTAEAVAIMFGFAVKRYPADWEKYGKSAGPIRNRDMLKDGADLVIAFRSTGESRGTDDMISLAVNAGIPVIVVHSDGTRICK